MNKEYEQLFVIGCPRSGTTFLSKLLSTTRFGKPYETHFIPQVLEKFNAMSSLSHSEFTKAFKTILRERSMQQYAREVSVDSIYNEDENNNTLYNLINYLAMQATNNKLPAWGDKTPWYITHIQQLSEFFPSARFIYIVRDPRAVTASLLKKNWAPKNAFACAKLWVEHNSIPAKTSEKLRLENRLHEVRYEDIVRDPVACLLAIYAFIGEPKHQIETKEIEQFTKNGNNNKWKAQLKESELKAIENVCWDKMEQFDYPNTYQYFPKISFIKTSYYRFHNCLLRFLFLVKLNTYDALSIKLGIKEPFNE